MQCLVRDGFRCRYCGAHATTADHIVAKALGGSDHLSNLVAARWPCNRKRAQVTANAIRNRGKNMRTAHWLGPTARWPR